MGWTAQTLNSLLWLQPNRHSPEEITQQLAEELTVSSTDGHAEETTAKAARLTLGGDEARRTGSGKK